MRNLVFGFSILVFFSCNQENTTKKYNFENLKFFLSINSYLDLQSTQKDIFPVKISSEIFYDTLFTFKQIDILKSNICSTDKYSFGYIPLKYSYNKKDYFLSAFPYTCTGSFPDMKVDMININIFDSNTKFSFFSFDYKKNYDYDYLDKRLNDKLIEKFSNRFKSFFDQYSMILSTYKDSAELKDKLKQIRYDYRFAIIVRVKRDKLLRKLDHPLDIVIRAYDSSLRSCVKKYYGKDLFMLNQDELCFFSRHLFLDFEISKQ